ncbi:ABC transporter permease [Micrococcus sp.]|uniref:ABC transporter permease n=1 Tax=Micrococcus sp. TaxID=1271 RepID=UPI002A91D947|nr:ABC transporter permease [Micrococcus sp.]MDY6055797.1 ABC transporter permease [Micrococcus sp.]
MSLTPSLSSPSLGPARPWARRLGAFVGRDLLRQLRMGSSLFFIAVLPTALFLMFGTLGEWNGFPLGHGNVMASTMTSMALYGAVTATTGLAGTAAAERQAGWGRQLALTALTPRDHMIGKALVALAVAVLPVALVCTVGALTGAELDGLGRWVATAALALVGSLPFALYGLAAALLFRSETAVSAASGLLVVFAFFGNLFIPLSGVVLDIARFTPLYGAGVLARWPQMEGTVVSMDATARTDSLGLAVVNLLTWTAVFAALVLLARRRGTAR